MEVVFNSQQKEEKRLKGPVAKLSRTFSVACLNKHDPGVDIGPPPRLLVW